MQTQSNNVDFAELAKFQDLASRWWDADSEFKPLHDINPLRLEWIANRVPLPGKKVLDVGCGGGILSESLSHAGAEVLGIDLAEAPLSVARLHALESGATLDYREISAEQCAAEMPQHFDCVTCLEMLEHVPDPALTVASCAAATKPGGRVFFSTINRNPKSWLFAIVGAEYVLRLLPKGTHEWQKFIKPSELAGYCRMAGLRVDEIIGLTYNPLNKRYKLEDDVQVNYMIATTRLEDTSSPSTREKTAVD
ncbi:MAG: bifunctional 2-polyprenyl-6-hydroxyphenol methylase/3-demethylubiquinol 3-O-methyltransferase UbiG [Granulosicoccus sp.]